MSTLTFARFQEGNAPNLDGVNLPNAAYEKLVEGLLKVATDAADKLVVNGNEGKREVALEALNVYVLAMMLGTAGEIGLNTSIGALIGGLVSSWSGPGMVLGAAIGGSVGLIIGMAPVLIIGMAYMDAVDKVNTKYPDSAQTASLVRIVPQAGRAESLAVHFVSLIFPRDLAAIAQRWDGAPGLPAEVRRFLSRHRYLQAPLRRLVSVIETQKVAPNAFPVRPLSQFDATRSLWYQQQPGQNWLAFMGLTTLKMRAEDAKLTLTLPEVLTQVGAPSRLRMDLPNFTIRVGGDGGAIPFIQFGLKPSAFDMALGETRVLASGSNRGKVRLSFRIARGATLGSASGGYKWGPAGGMLTFASPKLTEALSVEVFLKPEAAGLTFDHVEVGDIRLSLETPELIRNLPGIGGLIDEIVKGTVKFFKELFTSTLSWASSFQQLAGYSTKALESALAQTARSCGALATNEIRQLQSVEGMLRVLVRTVVLNLPGVDLASPVGRAAVAQCRALLRAMRG